MPKCEKSESPIIGTVGDKSRDIPRPYLFKREVSIEGALTADIGDYNISFPAHINWR
jgi:hypothetical protein